MRSKGGWLQGIQGSQFCQCMRGVYREGSVVRGRVGKTGRVRAIPGVDRGWREDGETRKNIRRYVVLRKFKVGVS